MTSNEHAHPGGYKKYAVIWGWLLLLTTIALVVGYFSFIPHAIKGPVLVTITLAKVFVIGAFFMHLKTEKINLIMCTFSPLLLAVILFFFTYGETVGFTPTHQIENVSPDFKLPAGHTGGHVEAPAAEEKK